MSVTRSLSRSLKRTLMYGVLQIVLKILCSTMVFHQNTSSHHIVGPVWPLTFHGCSRCGSSQVCRGSIPGFDKAAALANALEDRAHCDGLAAEDRQPELRPEGEGVDKAVTLGTSGTRKLRGDGDARRP